MNDPTTAGLRTSGSNPSLKPISNRAGSARSMASHFWGPRHALLKSNTERQSSVEKDLPVPPVLTQNHPTSIDKDTTQRLGPQESALQTPTLVENPVVPAECVLLGPASEELEGAAENAIHSSVDSYDHFHTWRLPVSKVRPAVHDTEDKKLEDQGEHPFESSILSGDGYPVENHFRHNRMNAPKVRPLMESPSIEAPGTHEGKGKADLTSQLHVQGDEKSQKMTSSGGFLPRLKEGQSSPHLGADLQEDRQLTASSHGKSSPPSQVDSHVSSTGVQPANLESKLKQDNLYRGDENNKRASEAFNSHSESETVPSSNGKSSGKTSPLISTASLPLSTPENINKEEKSFLPQKLNTLRTSKWLRGLLRFPEVDASPTLTKLPDTALPLNPTKHPRLVNLPKRLCLAYAPAWSSTSAGLRLPRTGYRQQRSFNGCHYTMARRGPQQKRNQRKHTKLSWAANRYPGQLKNASRGQRFRVL
ncbi:hypothetical protein F5B17DRAFT_224350 [Nemania serpens]|nr:hypothetical protein F5B17DRAFT_224350 [Nemania serpens]